MWRCSGDGRKGQEGERELQRGWKSVVFPMWRHGRFARVTFRRENWDFSGKAIKNVISHLDEPVSREDKGKLT
jgi:hypothetical protein